MTSRSHPEREGTALRHPHRCPASSDRRPLSRRAGSSFVSSKPHCLFHNSVHKFSAGSGRTSMNGVSLSRNYKHLKQNSICTSADAYRRQRTWLTLIPGAPFLETETGASSTTAFELSRRRSALPISLNLARARVRSHGERVSATRAAASSNCLNGLTRRGSSGSMPASSA